MKDFVFFEENQAHVFIWSSGIKYLTSNRSSQRNAYHYLTLLNNPLWILFSYLPFSYRTFNLTCIFKLFRPLLCKHWWLAVCYFIYHRGLSVFVADMALSDIIVIQISWFSFLKNNYVILSLPSEVIPRLGSMAHTFGYISKLATFPQPVGYPSWLFALKVWVFISHWPEMYK